MLKNCEKIVFHIYIAYCCPELKVRIPLYFKKFQMRDPFLWQRVSFFAPTFWEKLSDLSLVDFDLIHQKHFHYKVWLVNLGGLETV